MNVDECSAAGQVDAVNFTAASGSAVDTGPAAAAGRCSISRLRTTEPVTLHPAASPRPAPAGAAVAVGVENTQSDYR